MVRCAAAAERRDPAAAAAAAWVHARRAAIAAAGAARDALALRRWPAARCARRVCAPGRWRAPRRRLRRQQGRHGARHTAGDGRRCSRRRSGLQPRLERGASRAGRRRCKEAQAGHGGASATARRAAAASTTHRVANGSSDARHNGTRRRSPRFCTGIGCIAAAGVSVPTSGGAAHILVIRPADHGRLGAVWWRWLQRQSPAASGYSSCSNSCSYSCSSPVLGARV